MFCVIEEGEVRRAIEVELWSGSSALGDATGIKRPEDRAKGNQSGKKKSSTDERPAGNLKKNL